MKSSNIPFKTLQKIYTHICAPFIKIHRNNDQILFHACKLDHLDIVQWVFSLFEDNAIIAYRYPCEYTPEIQHWLAAIQTQELPLPLPSLSSAVAECII